MEIPIKINLPDQQQVSPYGQILKNVVVTDSGVRLRPGTTQIADTGAGVAIDGAYDWEEQGFVLIVAGGDVFKVSQAAIEPSFLLLESGDSLLLETGADKLLVDDFAPITDVTSDTMETGTPVIFGNYGDIMFMANGGKIIELHPSASIVSHGGTTYTCIKNNIDVEPGVDAGWATYWSATGAGGDAWSASVRYGSGLSEYLADAEAPTTVYWVGVADKYLHALESGTERMHFSVVQQPWSFDSDWVSAEFLPDDANCLRVVDGDVWVGGRRSLQVFNNDGVTPWVPSSYGAITTGVLAPYSFLNISGTFLWIDDNRRLVTLNGRVATSVNRTLDSWLETITRVDDAVASLVYVGGMQFYVLQFPTDQKTVALNIDVWSWAEWSASDGQWLSNSMTYVPSWDISVIGTNTGTVERTAYKYADDNGSGIDGVIRSPRIQSGRRARPRELVIGLTKVAGAAASGSSSFTVRWRDDGTDWKPARTVTLDQADTDHVVNLYRLGSYKHNRQYEFDVTNLWPFAIQGVEQL